MGKKIKFASMYRTTWSSVKGQCDPAAIKKCDFSKGLGPALDKLNKKCDKAWDSEPVPPKTLKALKKDVEGVQKIITKYVNQILKEKEKHPEFGESWLNLHNALKRVDDMFIDELDDLGFPDCKKIKGWAAKSAFAKRAVEGKQKDDVDLSKEVEKFVKKLESNKNNIEKVAKILGSKSMIGAFFRSQRVCKNLSDAMKHDRAGDGLYR